ncbi:bifunctional AAC/APH [Actinophytocola xanthii]|uniref:Bifunctional AAC/APH n=1 Tax=Actinophytocola xanthii TaxID=1912961 RepID=A0A1Q8CQK8_9PSEU|nr:bifunctional AAC/APH [Actinophytocola xanthii]
MRAVVERHLPDVPVESVLMLGTGRENTAYEVNGSLVVRFSTEPDPARRSDLVENEARLLSMVAAISPVPVPVPRFVDPSAGCLAYDKLPGTPLLAVPPAESAPHAEGVAAELGSLLAALHAVPLERAAVLVAPDEFAPSAWLREAASFQAVCGEQVPAAHREAVRRFLAAPPPVAGYEPVFSHNDLGIEHVLVDEATWRISGVIDWSDAAIVDPAFDFGKLLRDLGPGALITALRHYDRGDTARLAERATFYARCTVFEDLAHGLATDQEAYVAKCRASLTWLFPDQ